MKPTTRLRQLLNQPGLIVAPGCYDPLSAKLIEYSGFECVYMSGGSFAAAYLGAPDLALTTMTELATVARNITMAVGIPVIGDMETGFGSVLTVRRAMREYENSGLAGAHIEDQTIAKHCGHMSGKKIVPVGEMVGRIRAAVDARRDPDFVVIARCDAIVVEGLEASIERANRYVDAGADVIYMESPRSVEELKAIPPAIPVPVLIGQPENGISPLLSHQELEAMGVRIVTHPRSLRLMMVRGALDVLAEIRRFGTTAALQHRMVEDDELQKVLGTHEAEQFLADAEREEELTAQARS
jgi:2-methylisocitrate lyase-like PEP mutase family enzyme